MILIEFSAFDKTNSLLGIQVCNGEDDMGDFSMFSIGFLIFVIDIVYYG